MDGRRHIEVTRYLLCQLPHLLVEPKHLLVPRVRRTCASHCDVVLGHESCYLVQIIAVAHISWIGVVDVRHRDMIAIGGRCCREVIGSAEMRSISALH